jgi:hypothetical protein
MKWEQLATVSVGSITLTGAIVRNNLFVAGSVFGDVFIPDQYNEVTGRAGPIRLALAGVSYQEVQDPFPSEQTRRVYTLTLAQANTRRRLEDQ